MQEAIKPVYHKAGNVRFPYTRYHAALSLYECSSGTASATASMEDALYKSASMCLFAKLSLDQAIPDRAAICWSCANWYVSPSIPSTCGFLTPAS